MRMSGDERGVQSASSSISSVGDTTAIGMGGEGGSAWALGEGGKSRSHATGNMVEVTNDNRLGSGSLLIATALVVIGLAVVFAIVVAVALALVAITALVVVAAMFGLALVAIGGYWWHQEKMLPLRMQQEAHEHERNMEVLRYQLSLQRQVEQQLLIPALEQKLLAPPPPPEQSIEGEVLSYVALPK